jgi:hypothetical protein
VLSHPDAAANRDLEAGINPFATYRNNWREILLRSIEEPIIDDIAFPRFPHPAMQQRIHGSMSDRHSIEEALHFFGVIQSHVGAFKEDQRLLDFGSGWGRIVRRFMPYFRLNNIVGLEPNPWFCQVARALNPYVCFINSAYSGPSILSANTFDYVTSWSVFSHLSENRAREWIAEFSRVVRKGARIFLTTWGTRFLDGLEEEAASASNGASKNWYRQTVLKRCDGDVPSLRKRYESGEFVWLPGRNDYGEAFIPETAMQQILPRDLVIDAVDQTSFPQVMFVISKL